MTENKKTRKQIDLKTKESIIKELKNGKSIRNVAEMFWVSKGTVQICKERSDNIIEEIKSGAEKMFRVRNQSDINILLYRWFVAARKFGYPVTGQILKEKARVIARELKIHDGFSASDGWLQRFKHRNNIKYFSISGESATCDLDVVGEFRTKLKNLIENYSLSNIFNADETGYFFKALPNKTLGLRGEKCKGSKQAKDRIVILLAVSKTGEKLSPLIIGKAKTSRCFKNVDLRQYNIEYECSSKAWMTTNIFNSYLTNLNTYFKNKNRKILLFIDNAPVHTINTDIVLTHIEVHFLPPNLTACLQPLDAGVIRSLKVHARRLQITNLLVHMDKNIHASDLSQRVTLLDAIKIIAKSWELVKERTISNCFAECGFKKECGEDMNRCEDFFGSEIANLKEVASEIGISANDLCFEDEASPYEEIDINNLFDCIINDFLDDGSTEEEDGDLICAESGEGNNNHRNTTDIISNNEALDMTMKLMDYAKSKNFLTEEHDLVNLYRRIKREQQENMVQLTLDDFLKKENK